MRQFSLCLAAFVVAIVGCERPATTSGSAPPAGSGAAKVEPKAGATEEHEKKADAHGGAVIELGTTKIGSFSLRASRDQGELKAGGEAPIDMWLTTADGKPAQVSAVRFWIGAADAKGSLKAKADIEDPKEPNHWHTHVEVPDPLSQDARLWVEIEDSKGEKVSGSIDLKR